MEKTLEIIRKFFSVIMLLAGAFLFEKYFVLYMSNEGALKEAPVVIDNLTLAFSMPEPLSPWLLFCGGVLWASAMITWPHNRGIREYFKEIFSK